MCPLTVQHSHEYPGLRKWSLLFPFWKRSQWQVLWQCETLFPFGWVCFNKCENLLTNTNISWDIANISLRVCDPAVLLLAGHNIRCHSTSNSWALNLRFHHYEENWASAPPLVRWLWARIWTHFMPLLKISSFPPTHILPVPMLMTVAALIRNAKSLDPSLLTSCSIESTPYYSVYVQFHSGVSIISNLILPKTSSTVAYDLPPCNRKFSAKRWVYSTTDSFLFWWQSAALW